MSEIGAAFEQLVQIMRQLRGEHGCPWDKEQTHESLRQYLLEEAYEVLEAIDRGNYEDLREELGDLLLQVVFHAQIAEENRRFTILDVIQGLNEKLVRRHPHVFGDVVVKTAAEQSKHWEKLKRKEGKKSAIDGVPKALNALLRAQRVQAKASAVGFDWDKIDQVWGKVQEELHELEHAYQEGDRRAVQEELGDVLFALVNLSRFLGVSAEDALRSTVDKFSQRFRAVEEELRRRGKRIEDTDLEEMDAIWENHKRLEKARERRRRE